MYYETFIKGSMPNLCIEKIMQLREYRNAILTLQCSNDYYMNFLQHFFVRNNLYWNIPFIIFFFSDWLHSHPQFQNTIIYIQLIWMAQFTYTIRVIHSFFVFLILNGKNEICEHVVNDKKNNEKTLVATNLTHRIEKRKIIIWNWQYR